MKARGAVAVAALALLVVGLFLAALLVGPARLSAVAVAAALAGFGPESGLVIVREIRLPRAVLALLIGGVLGLAGAATQGLLRNPLAAPSLFGAPQAAALAAAATLSLGLADALSLALPLAAVAGALASVVLLVLVAGREAGTLVLILAGLAVSSLAGAGTALALNLAPNPFAALEIAFWLLGSLEDRSWRHVVMAAPLIGAGALLLARDGPALRALALGEEAAASLGVGVGAVRARVVLGCALGVGGAVAVAGAIGFVGLLAPHLARPLVGHDPGRALLPSALVGAAVLLAADVVARLLPGSSEVKVGVLTALVGAPFLLALIARERRALAAGAA